jgi:hypothetical protein
MIDLGSAVDFGASVTRPMTGVLIDDESTVTISSQGIKRPKGAKSSLKPFSFCSLDGDSEKMDIGGRLGAASSDFLTVPVLASLCVLSSGAGGRNGIIWRVIRSRSWGRSAGTGLAVLGLLPI